jgi:hypothetical protein
MGDRRNKPDLRRGREERFAALVKKRASAAGVTPSQIELDAQHRAPAIQALEEHARGRGVRLSELTAPLTAQEQQYPGAECLEPFEIEEYLAGALAPERVGHTRECRSCQGLLLALTPPADKTAAILQEVRDLAARAPAAMPSRTASRVPTGRVLSFVRDAAAAAFPFALTFSVAGIAATRSSFLSQAGVGLGIGLALGQVVLACVLAGSVALFAGRIWISRTVWGTFFRASGGALIGGIAPVLGCCILYWTMAHRPLPRAVSDALALEENAKKSAAGSLSAQMTSGEFPLENKRTGLLCLSTRVRDQNQAVYQTAATGLPGAGAMVANLTPNGGEVYFEWAGSANAPGRRELRAKLLAGTIRANELGSVLLEDRAGALHKLFLSRTEPRPALQQRVVAVVDAKNDTLVTNLVAARND